MILLSKKRLAEEEKEAIESDIDKIVNEWYQKTKSSDGGINTKLKYSAAKQYTSLLKRYGEDKKIEGWPTLNSMRNIDVESVISIRGGENR